MADSPAVDLQPIEVEGTRALQVTWEEGGTTFVAQIARVGDIPKLRSFMIKNPNGLPVDQRRIPTEASILGAVRDRREDAWPYWFHLMGGTFRHEGHLSEITEEVVKANLHEHQRELFNKPHSRRPELIDVAKDGLQQGNRTRDIVNTLIAQGVSEPTAFRYLRRARAALAASNR